MIRGEPWREERKRSLTGRDEAVDRGDRCCRSMLKVVLNLRSM